MNQESFSGALALADSPARENDRRPLRPDNDTVVIVIRGGKVVQFDNRQDLAGLVVGDGDGI